MKGPQLIGALLLLSFGIKINIVVGEVQTLTPPYFNLAADRRIYASSTCGEEGRELYCKLVGANADTDQSSINLIQGQVCDYCDASTPGLDHPAKYSIDSTERWWQSPSISRGMKYNEVNLTIDLGQEFHVAYVIITAGNSPRPGVWALERSIDNGKTYKPWQYFADNRAECEKFFGVKDDSSVGEIKDDTVLCVTEFSKVVPLEGGEIVVSLLKNRPSATDFFSSDVLQEWTRATNIRFRLMRTKTLLGHLMSVARQDPTVTRRYFYSVKDISIGGRCRCNGHADLCDITDPRDVYKLLCRCQHHTCGAQCESCCPGYVQKAWRPSTHKVPYSCEKCNCFGHSEECYYDPEVDANSTSIDMNGDHAGGGVCTNCRDNTKGINCNECQDGFYRPFGRALDAYDVCEPCVCDSYFSTGNCAEGTGKCECKKQFEPPECDRCSVGHYDYPECKACDCNFYGTRGDVCEVGGGQCPCKYNYAGQNCERCAEGYFNFPNCTECACENLGSVSPVCDLVGGQCECANNFGGRQCNECENGYYKFPECNYCNCDVRGTREGICEKDTGKCMCKEGYGGDRCDQCQPGFYGNPCRPCNCSTVGSATSVCDSQGKCPCLPNFSARTCNQCSPGYYLYPECLPCNCFEEGSMGVSCDDEGICQCKVNFATEKCGVCREGTYNFPLCEECNCDPSGVIESFSGCGDSPPGELCQCKERVQGRICNDCKPLFWNLRLENPLGCQDCDCHLPGLLGGVNVCDSGKGGQCPCKSLVQSRRCEECSDGYYDLQGSNVLGCTDCGCTIGASVNNVCDKGSGQCICRPRINGRTCTQPLQAHFFPNLFQFQYEVEDGYTPSGGAVRFGYDASTFPEYSWRGYAIYSQLQPLTMHDIHVEKSSLYRIVLRYVNPSDSTITGEISLTPDNPNDAEQSYKIRFEPNNNFLTVSTGNVPSPFVLNPGRWVVQLKILNEQYLLIDYFTLLPAAYYEGTILQRTISVPCTLEASKDDICQKLSYPSMDKFDSVGSGKAYTQINGGRDNPKEFYRDKKVLGILGVEDPLVIVSPKQKEIQFEMNVSKGGRYAIVIEYWTPGGANFSQLDVESSSKKGKMAGGAKIYDCQHSTLCRSLITTPDGEIGVFRFDQSSINFILQAPEDLEAPVGISSVSAIPLGKWSLDYIRPKEYCVMKGGVCIDSSYDVPPDSIKVEAESSRDDSGEDSPEGADSETKLVVLDAKERSIELSGKVSNPGFYSFLVHYHQPENPEFILDAIIANGQHYEAKVPVVHCPSTSGCRTLIVQDDNSKFFIEEEFKVTLKSPKKIWIDYIVAVPSGLDDAVGLKKYLAQNTFDETSRFISECGKNHMFIPDNATGFCRDAIFSLTTDFNNGAMPCNCDFDGSTSFECASFGGQCACKENIVGRRCERCRTGFFGFPNCQPCNCPSTALCDQNDGRCICPPRVSGDRCEKCDRYTYGYDPIIGCEECMCSAMGTVDGNLQCDLENGQCECRVNVVGRKCDRCANGHWAYPYCQLCDCHLAGTTQEICNQEDSTCSCKVNAEGRSCENCVVGSFNLEERNPAGCTKCFCFGKTSRCASSSLFWNTLPLRKEDISAVGIDPKKMSMVKGKEYGVEFEEVSSEEAAGSFIPVYLPEGSIPRVNESHVLYFVADVSNNSYLSSYGGKLSYFVISDPEDEGDRDTFGGPDLILEAKDLTSENHVYLMHFGVEHLDGEHALKMSLPLTEENLVVYSTSGGLISATREQVMIALKGLSKIYVRGTYWLGTREAKLGSFGIEGAGEEYSPFEEDRATSVEHCQCPRNYQGLSCEECAPGFFRSSTGPFGGFCIPCECNGHSESCDPETGICKDCRYNTTGDHCDKCEVGYHGDATVGTPYDCLICACPLPLTSNNFATSCELSQDGLDIYCSCTEGYAGQRCDICAPGFYGRPETQGDTCKPCQCSGNIDVKDPNACDRVTGQCLQCLNNTSGPYCNICAPGFHGDAVERKNCIDCDCDMKCGTEECLPSTGECRCLNNVIGVNCDRCAPDHWGMSRCDGTGCHICECGIASFSSQCDDLTGQCECRKGAAGLRCDKCAPGYWNYTEEGCQSCECNQEYAIGVGCDWRTGQCSCLPGVVGERCDRCPFRWVLIEDRGCQECEPCQHQLLDVTDVLKADLDPILEDFDSVAKSYFTAQKLTFYNETVDKLRPEVRLMDPSKIDLNPYKQSLIVLESESKSSKQMADVTRASLRDKSGVSLDLRVNSAEIESKVQEAVAIARHAVFETKDLLEGLSAEEQFSSPQTEFALVEARAIIDALTKITFDDSDAQKEAQISAKIVEDMLVYIEPIGELQDRLKAKSERINSIKDKIKDLRNQSDYSMITAKKANEFAYKIKEGKFQAKLDLLERRAEEMLVNLGNATEKNALLPGIIKEAEDHFKKADKLKASIRKRKDPLGQTMDNLKNELDKNVDTIGISREHAWKMKMEADNLDRMLEGARGASEGALAAANSYQTISDTIEEALNSALLAKEYAANATEKIRGIDEEAKGAMEPAQNLLVMAGQSVQMVGSDLKIPLVDFKSTLNEIEDMNKNANDILNNIDKSLDKVKLLDNTQAIKEASQDSDSGKAKAEGELNKVEEILEKLPTHIEKARDLPVIVKDLNKRVEIAENQLKTARESIPLSAAITGDLEEKSPKLADLRNTLSSRIGSLKGLISEAREQANRIPVGMNLIESSSLLLANPMALESQSAQSKISLHFRTKDDGSLLYIGNEPGRRGSEGDFLAIEIERGYATLTIDLGSGPQRIFNEKFVADDKWYKAIIDRTGKAVRFIIAEEGVDGVPIETTKEEYLGGSKSLFNVDRNSSRIYVGGLPPGEIKAPLRYSSFRGTVEDFRIGEEIVGLWNFRDGLGLSPAYEKDRFLNLRPETGLRFQGNGWALVKSAKYPLKHNSRIRINFNTRAKNGLIFLVGHGKKFLAIEIVNGNVVFSYDLGSGIGRIASTQTFNDGKWHLIEAVRQRKVGLLRVDAEEIGRVESPGNAPTLGVSEYIYFGGYPGTHDYTSVTQKAFEGCLDGVSIESLIIDLTRAPETRYTLIGCPSSGSANTITTFHGKGFLSVSTEPLPINGPLSSTSEEAFELNFRFKSTGTHGLLFYGTNSDQSNYLSISMAEGSLYVQTSDGASIKTDPLHESQWVTLTVARDAQALRVNVDDSSDYTAEVQGVPLNPFGSTFFFGGRPENYEMKVGAATADSPFSGCLADIHINQKPIDYTDAQVHESTLAQSCSPPLGGSESEESGELGIPKGELEEDQEITIRPHHHKEEDEEDRTIPIPEGVDEENSIYDPFDYDSEEKIVPWKEKDRPQPYKKCKLPFRGAPPDVSPSEISLDDGVRFGNYDRTSRMEFSQVADDGSRSEYSLEFKTSEPDGILFMWSDHDRIDYVTLYMRRGRIHYAFDSGSGQALLNSTALLNDSSWHSASFTRYKEKGELTIDGVTVATGISQGSTTNINAGPVVSIGGLSKEAWGRRMTLRKLQSVDSPFRGCLRNFQIKKRDPGPPKLVHSVEPCTDNMEPGYEFYPKAGFIKLTDRFRVGKNIKLTLSIKPRHPTGLILSVHGDRDFMVLQMINGTIKFTVDNGRGPVSSSFSKEPFDLCDGNWHTIQASKSKNVVTLSLDNLYSEPGIGAGGIYATDTNHPLYLGGHERLESLKGVEAKEQFVGCIKDIVFEGRHVKRTHSTTVGKVGQHSCRTD